MSLYYTFVLQIEVMSFLTNATCLKKNYEEYFTPVLRKILLTLKRSGKDTAEVLAIKPFQQTAVFIQSICHLDRSSQDS